MALTTVRPEGMGFNTGRRNLVINGAMQVAQRGTSASVSNDSNEGYQTLDRFKFDYGNNAGGVATISQDTTVPSGYGFSNSYKVDVTTADTSLDSTHQIFFRTILEAQDIRNSGWNYTSTSSFITLSFWVKSSKAGTYNIAFRASDVGALYYLVEYTLVADTWKKVTATIPGDSSLVFNNDNGNGLEIRWNLALGTDRNDGTANQWNSVSSNNAGTSNQVNFFDSTSNDFYLTGVQLEVGENASDFEHRSFGEELSLCQRYCSVIYPNGSSRGFIGFGSAHNTTNPVFFTNHPVTMRTIPSVTVSAVDDFSFDDGNSSTTSTNMAVQTLRSSAQATAVIGTASSLTQFRPYALNFADTTNGFINFDAEL